MRRLLLGVVVGILPFTSAFANMTSDLQAGQPMSRAFAEVVLELAPTSLLNAIDIQQAQGLTIARGRLEGRPATPPPFGSNTGGGGGGSASPS